MISPQLFALFAGLVEDTAGLHYAPQDRELFASKLVAHAAEQGFDALLDYYYALRYDDPSGAARAKLVETLLVHETYFFRELPALVAIADHLAAVAHAHGRARAWSAACATGEEPYTLAMLLDQRGVLDAVEIVATDVSPACLARARSGHHARRALRDGHPDELARRYLETDAHGVSVAPRIRDAVAFRALNLVEDPPAELGAFDAILCRNVLIYFRDEQIVRVIDRLAARLAPGGLLAVGVSESLQRFGTKLACIERGHSFFYRVAP